jgi:hypothetical protein
LGKKKDSWIWEKREIDENQDFGYTWCEAINISKGMNIVISELYGCPFYGNLMASGKHG